jgi:uncharacterized protein
MHVELAVLAGLFLIAALVYSSVGFGGGSAYLAMLSLSGVPLQDVAIIALVCNIIVVSGGTWHFIRAGHFSARLAAPFLVFSLPAAFVGGSYRFEADLLGLLMGIALLIAAGALTLSGVGRMHDSGSVAKRSLWIGGATGGTAIGALSGVIGIGGGVFLSPLLHLAGWGTARQIAATASLFILLNSAAGIAGKLSWIANPDRLLYFAILPLAVLIGGQIGSRLGASFWSALIVRRITAFVVAIAAISLMLRSL